MGLRSLSALLVSVSGIANAQAWVPEQGQGAVTLAFQRISNTGHRLADGELIRGGQSLNMALYLQADYAATNRLSFSAGLPYVFGKYTDAHGPPPPLPYLPWDQCRCWRSGPQDVGLTARYNVLLSHDGTFALTPSVSGVVPSNKYEYRGESVQGRDLRELDLAVDIGQRLDAVSPNLSVLGHYSYAFVERVLNIPNNRSNASAEGRYSLFRGRLVVRGFTLWQRTHGGLSTVDLKLGTPIDELSPSDRELVYQHDRLLRDNSFHAGGGLNYSFPKVDVFGSYLVYVNGTNTHSGDVLTVGLSWPFEWRRRR